MRGEPAAVREIPQPHRFSPSLPFAEADEWFVCGAPVRARQGWKLYVSLTLLNAPEVIEQLVPLVQRAGLHFKYIKNIKLLRKLNAGMFGYPQIGKCFVIYVPKPRAAFITELKTALAPYRDQCPAVPCALPFGDDLPLYYRYGSYQSSGIKIGSAEVEDDRVDVNRAVPKGVKDSLARYTAPISENIEVQSFLLRYPVYEAIIQQGKCGVFKALNLDSEVFEEVILKIGYHRGQVQPDGGDGCCFLRRELAFYRELTERGLRDLAPQLIDALDVPRKVILVLEYASGGTLLEHKLLGTLSIDHLNQCWRTMEELHAGGVYWGDAKLANFLITQGDGLRIVDFEGGGVVGEKPPATYTFLIDPLPDDPRAADRAHFLASVLFPYEVGRYSWEDRHVDLRALVKQKPQTDIAAWAIDKLQSVVLLENSI